MPVPNTFASATSAIPLANLDTNFATPITLGNTAVQLGNTITTINSVTLVTPTINTITSGSGSNLVLQSNNAVTAVTIDTAQNLGLGVTPSAWGSGAKVLQALGNGAFFVRNIGTGYTAVSSNYLYNTSGQDAYIANGYATSYVQYQGQHQWYVAPSNSSGAGALASFTQEMLLDNSGNFLLGQTSLGYGTNVKALLFAPSTYGVGVYTTINYSSGGSVYFDIGQSRVSGGYSTNNGYIVGYRQVVSNIANAVNHANYDIYGYTANSGGDVSQTGSYFRINAGTISFPSYGAGTLSTNASGVISASDARFKIKTRSVENGLNTVLQLQPTYYRWKDDCVFHTEHEELGFFAQEVGAVIPEASPEPEEAPVLDKDGNMLSVKYKNYHDRAIVAVMVKAIQELSAKVTALEAKVGA